jgi:hypothetical protein
METYERSVLQVGPGENRRYISEFKKKECVFGLSEEAEKIVSINSTLPNILINYKLG